MENKNSLESQTTERPVILSAHNLSRTYKVGRNKVTAVDDVSFDIRQGEMVALVGSSGSGKSTILSLLGGLEKPTAGSVSIDGTDLKKLSDAKLSRYRGQKIGFVFQSFYLQPFLDVQTNIEVPTMFAGIDKQQRHKRSSAVASAVGLTDRLRHRPKELSGGQIQRAAIARALINQPKILLADEPTGNLDSVNSRAIYDLFVSLRDKYGTTIVVVTHDEELAGRADRVIHISDGRVVS